MTNKVCIPVEIIRNTKLSPRARLIWAELSLLPKGAVGEFVVKHKELSKLLGICDSTLRRAVKTLEEAGLIQCVGLFEKRLKKYVFKNCHSGLVPESSLNVDIPEKIPQPTFSKGDLNPPTNNAFDGKYLLANWQKIYKEKPEAVVVEIKSREEKTDGPYKLKYQFKNGVPSSDDKMSVVYAKSLCKLFHEQWRKKFPLLNGHDKRPLLNPDLIELIVLSHPSNLGGQKMLDVIDADLQRYMDGSL